MPHLPLATDTYGAYLMCAQVREELARVGVEAVIAVPYYFGINSTTAMFPGSLSISRAAMVPVLTEALRNYASWGFTRQFVLNHHGDPEHNDAVMEAIRSARCHGVDAVLTLGGFVGEVVENVYASAFRRPLPLPESAILRVEASEETRRARARLTRSQLHVHAEERETSMIMRWFPETLSKSIDVGKLEPVLPAMDDFNEQAARGRWRELSPLGYIGDPSAATTENGELYRLEAADMARAIAFLLTGEKDS